jgi:L-asparaginase II
MPVLVEVTRGEITESVHMGDIAVVNCSGEILHGFGDPGRISYMRSASKPIQAVAMLECGVYEKYGLGLEEVAVMLSSHSGEPMHIAVLERLLEKTGVEVSSLRCGTHRPLSAEASVEMMRNGKLPSPLHNNCSGKHIGQIAAAMARGYRTENYDSPDHPIQKDLLNVVSEFAGLKPGEIKLGIDGCGVPVYGMPLKNMAQAYANLCNPGFMGGKYGTSCGRVLSAMTVYPELIGGKGRFDTELLRHFGNRLIAKSGFEGVFCLGLTGKGIGIAIKVEDGNKRAVSPAVMEILRQLQIVPEEELADMEDYWHPHVHNHRGENVGEIRPVFFLA